MSAEGSTQLILLSGVFGVLVVILIILASISRILLRMERKLRATEPTVTAVAGKGESHTSSMKAIAKSGAFLAFLSEDPQRRSLTKREQFAAYRKWRKEKGLSWPQSPEQKGSA